MRVFTWLCSDGTLPPKHRALARIMLNDGGWHPVLISGPTEAAAAETAASWWRDELAKGAAKHGRKERPEKSAPSAVDLPSPELEDPGDVV